MDNGMGALIAIAHLRFTFEILSYITVPYPNVYRGCHVTGPSLLLLLVSELGEEKESWSVQSSWTRYTSVPGWTNNLYTNLTPRRASHFRVLTI